MDETFSRPLPSSLLINSNNGSSLKFLREGTSQAETDHPYLTKNDKHASSSNPVGSGNKEGSGQETPNSTSSTNTEECSYFELAGRKRAQKYAWLDDEEEKENVSHGQFR